MWDPSWYSLNTNSPDGNKVYNKVDNQLIIRETIKFTKITGRCTLLEAFPHFSNLIHYFYVVLAFMCKGLHVSSRLSPLVESGKGSYVF